MCQRFPRMYFDWGAIFKEIEDLSERAKLAVLTLIGKAWENGAPLPDNPKKIARVLGRQGRTWLEIRAEIAPLFDLSEGAWNHRQLQDAWQHIECRIKARSQPPKFQKVSKEFAFAGHNPLKTNDPPSQRKEEKPIEPKEGSIGRPDVREKAPAASPTAHPFSARSRQRREQGKRSPTSSRRTAIAAGWMPSVADIAFAEQRGFSNHADFSRQAQRFADFHTAHATRSADWGAEWRLWIDRAVDFKPRGRREPFDLVAALNSFRLPGEDDELRYG